MCLSQIVYLEVLQKGLPKANSPLLLYITTMYSRKQFPTIIPYHIFYILGRDIFIRLRRESFSFKDDLQINASSALFRSQLPGSFPPKTLQLDISITLNECTEVYIKQ
jgi:hypothetical protein